MIKTVEQAVEALGGTGETAKAARVNPSAVSNWKTRGYIPSDRYLLIKAELKRRGQKVSPRLFGFETEEAAS